MDSAGHWPAASNTYILIYFGTTEFVYKTQLVAEVTHMNRSFVLLTINSGEDRRIIALRQRIKG
jgi:hypothetical protein